MERTELTFSILVTTQGRTHELAAFMRSLCQQGGVSCTLIAGMQETPTDPTSLIQNPPYAIVHKALPRLGLSQARNALLTEATGDILALADDDCLYPPDLLPAVAKFFKTHPRCAVLICDADCQKPTPQKRWQVLRKAPSYTLFFKRSAVTEIGPFDENMGIGADTPWQSGEETDFVLRIMERGYQVWRIPAPRIQHPDVLQTDSINTAKVIGYARGRMYLLQKHGFCLGFKILNILFPALIIFVDIYKTSIKIFIFRMSMLKGRVSGIFLCR